MRLTELQQQFQQRVLTRRGLIGPELMGSSEPDFDARLGAYVEGYRSRLVEALGATYPALKATLGEEGFGQCMRDYIEATPSHHYSVRYYGAGVSELMAAQGNQGDGARGQVLADLARWEWMLAEVFDAPDDESLGVEALGAVPPEAWASVTFQFRACVRQIDLHSNAVDFWRASKDLCAAPGAFETAPPSRWLLWRRGLSTLFRSVDPSEATALDGARAGLSFGALCAALAVCVEETEVAMRAASLLRGWLSEELIAGYTLPDAPR
jgi:Putative DNA-binding domain